LLVPRRTACSAAASWAAACW